MIYLGFTGTSAGLVTAQFALLQLILDRLPFRFVARHGDCVGADARFHDLVAQHPNCDSIIVHPPSDDKRRAFCAGHYTMPLHPYLTRNRHIVDGSDRMIACPRLKMEEQRSGTWATIRYARRRQKPLIIVWPDGTTFQEGWVL